MDISFNIQLLVLYIVGNNLIGTVIIIATVSPHVCCEALFLLFKIKSYI